MNCVEENCKREDVPCHVCHKCLSHCKCPSEFCTYCTFNLKIRNEDRVLHEMICIKQYQALAVNEYQRDRLLAELLKHTECNTGDFYHEVISKLCILKYGKPMYDFIQIKKDLNII